MQTSIKIYCSENTDSKFAGQIRLWAEEIVGSLAGEAAPKLLSIRIYRLIDELRLFFRQEKEALGVVWEHSYDWLSEEERHRMMRFAANTAASTTRPFQNWLEETALNLIVDPRLWTRSIGFNLDMKWRMKIWSFLDFLLLI